MNLISTKDMEYYINQSTENINEMLAGMSTIINGIDYQVEFLENQSWLQRIMKTITGQNKVTKEEIKRNYEKLTICIVDIIQELYKANIISYQFLFNLSNNINKVYSEHSELFKEVLEAKKFFKDTIIKLNNKIKSIDNFYMLNEEIRQGKYIEKNYIVILCDVIKNLDKEIIFDERKMNILYINMKQQNIVNDKEIPIINFFKEILNLPINILENIFIELNSLNKTLLTKILFDIIGEYYFSKYNKILESKELIIKNILTKNAINVNLKISTKNLYFDFVENKIEMYKDLEETEKILKNEEVKQNNKILNKEEIKIPEPIVIQKPKDINKEISEMTKKIMNLMKEKFNFSTFRASIFPVMIIIYIKKYGNEVGYKRLKKIEEILLDNNISNKNKQKLFSEQLNIIIKETNDKK